MVIGVVEVVVVVNIVVVKISSLDMTRHLFCGGKSVCFFYSHFYFNEHFHRQKRMLRMMTMTMMVSSEKKEKRRTHSFKERIIFENSKILRSILLAK